MTGFGEAHHRGERIAVSVEVRAVNNRHYKLSFRSTEGYGGLESEIDKIVRKRVRRGTVQLNLRVERKPRPEDFQLNLTALESYRRQLETLYAKWRVSGTVLPEHLLALPGVVDEASYETRDAQQEWEPIRAALEESLDALTAMREQEGRAMADDLKANCDVIASELSCIQRRAPQVSEGYRKRLEERVKNILTEYEVSLDPGDLLREVSIFAERCDISEEAVRLRSHLDQFQTTMELPESAGRKLDFLTQEMFRETNTIGSKANDTEIPKHVIEIKAAIERVREMVQNIE